MFTTVGLNLMCVACLCTCMITDWLFLLLYNNYYDTIKKLVIMSSFSTWRHWKVERNVSQEAEVQSYNFNVWQAPVVSSRTSASNCQIAGKYMIQKE